MDYEAGTIEKAGVTYPVFVTDGGQWAAFMEGARVESTTKEALGSRLAAIERKNRVQVAVPFSRFTDTAVQHGTVTGRNAANRNFLVTWSDGSKQQLARYDVQNVTQPLDDADVQEWDRLRQARKDATQALHAFEGDHRFDLGTQVDNAMALAEAVAAQENGIS